MTGISPNAADLEVAFAIEVFDMLKKEGKISHIVIGNMNTWQHSGFNVYCGPPVEPWDDDGVERLAQYIVRAPFSQERMNYIPRLESLDGVAKVVYEGKTSRVDETFTALDWLARLVTHIPGKGKQMVRYYGYYSNKSRGVRKKEGSNDDAKSELVTVESDISSKKFHKNWARLIQKIYNVDPLLCPKCGGAMRIIYDPPSGEKDRIALYIQSHRSFEWEAVNHVSGDEDYNDRIVQTPYEDEYS